MAQQKETRATLNHEPAGRTPGNDARTALRLAVGDRVVYASHGIGRVESREHHRAKTALGWSGGGKAAARRTGTGSRSGH
jgi:CarD-like/TRCF RID domain